MSGEDHLQNQERLLGLQVDRALGALDPGTDVELEGLEASYPEMAGDELELVVAELAASLVDAPRKAPAALMAKLRADAPQQAVRPARPSRSQAAPRPARQSAPRPATTTRLDTRTRARREEPGSPPSSGTPGKLLAFSGWLVAAAALILLAVLSRTEGAVEPREQWIEFVAQAEDLVRIPWAATEDENVPPGGVTGEVVWSPRQQQGFMRFEGMPTNDPTQQQYQLWIIDGGREGESPVDGGVFDVTATGEVYVPIDAKLLVNQAAAFAVTLEKPGGVVVSAQEHVLLLAQA